MHVKDVERAHPGCIIFLLDQSFSMVDGMAGTPKPKCEVVATAINRFLGELVMRCERNEATPRPYFDVGVIGYTTDKSTPPMPIIGSVLQGALAGRPLVNVVDLFENMLELQLRQVDDGEGGLIDKKFPIWYKLPPKDEWQARMGGTPMTAVMQYCAQVAKEWCAEPRHTKSFPPMVIHLTDGQSTDGNPEGAAEALKSICTDDGPLLLFNCHISESMAVPVLFPAVENQLNDQNAQLLFRMSSPLPEKCLQMARSKNIQAEPGARGMAFNADSTSMIQLITVGTPVASPEAMADMPR